MSALALDIDGYPVAEVAGVDEAGRGPLAGPVAAAAVILGADADLEGLDDSKKLSEARRQSLDVSIRRQAVAFAVVFSPRTEIDRINILHATMNAMAAAVSALTVVPSLVLVDGNRCPPLLDVASRAEVAGDARFACIAAASILAKVARDRYMIDLDERYPGYGFARHKGYGTVAHREALVRLGPTPEHRVTFSPVRDAMAARTLPLPEAGHQR